MKKQRNVSKIFAKSPKQRNNIVMGDFSKIFDFEVYLEILNRKAKKKKIIFL